MPGWDPNKSEASDYVATIRKWSPRFLVEIHGHGGRSANFDVEISCGSEERAGWAEALSQILEAKLASKPEFKQLSISGEWSEIHFKASKTLTLQDDHMIGFHLELPPVLRKRGLAGAAPPPIGYHFCDMLAPALIDLLVRRAAGSPPPVTS